MVNILASTISYRSSVMVFSNVPDFSFSLTKDIRIVFEVGERYQEKNNKAKRK